MNGIPEGTISVGICETQPLVVAGLKAVLAEGTGFQLLETRSLEEAGREVIASAPQVFILDKALGTPAISEWLTKYRDRVQTKFVIWGPVMTEPEALRFLKFGARGIVRKTAEAQVVIACLQAVVAGETWMEDTLFHNTRKQSGRLRTELTVREQQVLELVEQGLRNKDIARELDIRPGTVKIHLKHIFEKTGVRGRYGLALNGLQQRTVSPMLHV